MGAMWDYVVPMDWLFALHGPDLGEWGLKTTDCRTAAAAWIAKRPGFTMWDLTCETCWCECPPGGGDTCRGCDGGELCYADCACLACAAQRLNIGG